MRLTRPESASSISSSEALMSGRQEPRLEEGQTVFVQVGGVSTTADSARGRRNRLIYQIGDLLAVSILMIFMQRSYAPTWGDDCDYNLKIWSTVWLAAQLLRSLLLTISSAILVATQGEARRMAAYLRQPFIDLFVFGWFLYGTFPLFINKPDFCNVYSKVWSIGGWVLQAVSYFLPCILIICCVPCLLCVLRISWIRDRLLPVIFGPASASTNQQPTPEELLARLTPTTFMEAIARDEIDLEPVNPPLNREGSRSGGGTHENVSALISATLPDTFSQAVNTLMTRLGSTVNNNNAPSGQYYQASGTLTCPICVMEFERADIILRLPCDPRRHVFHQSCIQEWLRKSQHCPMCRKNIAELLGGHEAATVHDEPPYGYQSPQDNV